MSQLGRHTYLQAKNVDRGRSLLDWFRRGCSAEDGVFDQGQAVFAGAGQPFASFSVGPRSFCAAIP